MVLSVAVVLSAACFVNLGGLSASSPDGQSDAGVDVTAEWPVRGGLGDREAWTADFCRVPRRTGRRLLTRPCPRRRALGGAVTIPSGWSSVGLDLTKTGTCPAGYLSSNVIAEASEIDATLCFYSCTPGSVPCTGGTIEYKLGAFCWPVTGTLSEAPGCQPTSLIGGSGLSIQFAASEQTDAGCDVMGAVKIAPNARLCGDPGSTICNGSTCHPGLVSPFQAVSSQPHFLPRQAAQRASRTPSPSPARLRGTPPCTVTASCGGTVELFAGFRLHWHCDFGSGRRHVQRDVLRQHRVLRVHPCRFGRRLQPWYASAADRHGPYPGVLPVTPAALRTASTTAR